MSQNSNFGRCYVYAPEVRYTLVSVGKLNDSGYVNAFGGGKCTLVDSKGITIGAVPKTNGLYHVVHEPERANAAEEELTLESFHRRMGHISPKSAQKFV